MKANIKYNELEKISKFVVSKSEELDGLYKEIDKIIDSISASWQGSDCETFIEEAKKYIEQEYSKNKEINKFGSVLNTISNDYKKIEKEWVEDLKRGIIDNE